MESEDKPDSTAEQWVSDIAARVKGRDKGVVLTHDNPDPDAMASAAGMSLLLSSMGVDCKLAYGGIIGRAENRAVVRNLDLPMTPLHRVGLGDDTVVVLVDTQPQAGNHSLDDEVNVDIVVDHHPHPGGERVDSVMVVDPVHGATSSLVTRLLRAAGIEPDTPLATALFYGVKTDTRGLGREASEADTGAYQWLFPRSDQEILAHIEHPQVPLEYFQAYHRAYERARVYGKLVFCDMGEVYQPDIVPEVAERLLFLEGTKWSVALGLHEEQLFVSMRTNDRRMNCGKQLRELLADMSGSAGGHGQMAGGRIPVHGWSEVAVKRLVGRIRNRLVESLNGAKARGKPLVEAD